MNLWYSKLPLFRCWYKFTLCLNGKDYEAALRQVDIPARDRMEFLEKTTASAETHIFEKQRVCIVCMQEKDSMDSLQVAALLVHEAVHIWRHSCLQIGENSPAMEQEAYGIQAISQALMDLYVCRKKRSTKWIKDLVNNAD